MLVLSRKVGEKINIGDNIVLIVVRVQGDKIRLGIDAPKDVPVIRDELMSPDQLKEIYSALSKTA